MKSYSLSTLPSGVVKYLLASHSLADGAAYRADRNRHRSKGDRSAPAEVNLFAMFAQPEEAFKLEAEASGIIWATDSYDGHDENFFGPITLEKASLIVPRSEKAKEEQKRRTKDKAEVFTPSWVCNLQNNLVDDALLYPGAFTTAEPGSKTWTPTITPIDFSKAADPTMRSWLSYVVSPRLEITCGEGPYLFSRYDTVTGEDLPVYSAGGESGGASGYQRIGVLDRKFRVIAENTAPADRERWLLAARAALSSTFGYEWQGDNLLLARLNFLNTFVDYHLAFLGELPDEKLLEEVAELASWQLWQMDGLKMVRPLSCSGACPACAERSRDGHDGAISVLWWKGELKPFEAFLQ
jgi:hypothetical protein